MEEEKRMPGYTGYKPQYVNDDDVSASTRDNRFYIPGKYQLINLNNFNLQNRILWICSKH